MKEEVINHNSSIIVATFSHYEDEKRLPRNGMIDPILSFFLPKVKDVILIDQPHPVSNVINPVIEMYAQGKIKKKFTISPLLYFPIYLFCKIPSKSRTRVSYKLRDFFSVIYAAFIGERSYDLFIGLEGINALAGILLKKIGKVKTVVYYVSDYSPARFGKAWLNPVYLLLDHFCVKYADFTWDVSPAMKEARLDAGLASRYAQKILHVPNGLFASQIKSLPFSQRLSGSLVYLGSSDVEFGVELAIEVLKKVRETRPEVTLRIIGGGDNLPSLKSLVKKLGLEESVIFHGFVVDNNEMAKIVRNCYIGLAPYRSAKDSHMWYAWYGDAGKIRQYLASGLPVVTTHVPPLGREVAARGAAIMTKDTIKDFSDGILQLLLDKKLYIKLSKKAEELSRNNTWEKVYTKTISEMSKSSA